MENTVLKKANHIIELCHPEVPLRTLDAIHAATCDLAQDFPLCTTDRRMRDAAKKLGIPVFPEALNE
jgi:predicted nucleic acid-binding protein